MPTAAGVLDAVMHATANERAELAKDEPTLYAVCHNLGAEAYDDVYRAITGDYTLGDALRAGDAGALDIAGQGWGTDEKGMGDATAQFVGAIKAQYEADPDGVVDDPRFRKQCRELFLDPDSNAVLERELSGSDLVSLRLAILGGGASTPLDDVRAAARDGQEIGAIVSMIQGLEDGDRKALADDPSFLVDLGGLTGGTRAIRILEQGDLATSIDDLLDAGVFDSCDEETVASPMTGRA